LCYLLLAVASFAAFALAQTIEVAPSDPHRVRVSEVIRSSPITEKSPLKYPDAARNAGIQGVVVLKVVVGETGEAKRRDCGEYRTAMEVSTIRIERSAS